MGELFDTLLVFENYPVDRAGLAAQANGLRLGRVEGRDATHYPLALIVQPGEELQLRLDYRPDLFDAASVAALGARLIRLLEAVAADAGAAARRRCRSWTTAERDTILRVLERHRAARRRHAAAARRCRRCSRRRRRARRMRSRWCSRTAR